MAESISDAARTTATTPHDSGQTNMMVTNDNPTSDLGSEPVAGEGREPEEALETHEVVELNKFTTKKEWIEEKINLLESMPPIEVFAAVETLATMSDAIPLGLPTRAQLDRWLEEHDKTEKETEIFDAEDMSKLKKLTKAATQRNLSPEDTDLIELTLTTLLALDKLLHLLRDRSEMLDLLGLRLTWEEQRTAAWRERKSILDDLHSFLAARGRWSLDTYELPLPNAPSPSPGLRFPSPSPSSSPRVSPTPSKRRDSAASLTSISSDTSISNQSSSTFSRSIRYRLAEVLSHDAALFSGRVTTLNHGKIIPAGKILDRLIDASRTPVPDEILDEQDRLEDKGIKDLETIGKFAMAVVMQWKRADEHYNDIKRDQAAAQSLISELNNAKVQHPTSRLDAAFMSRAQALTKRLALKGDPALPRSSFPRPSHPLFPDQAISNEAIAKTLSMELAEAKKLAREAEAIALAYHAGLVAVVQAESLRDQMRAIDEQIQGLVRRLVEGVHDEHGHGDGTPLDLNNEACLDLTRHATYLALLPSVTQQLETAERASDVVLRDGRVGLLHLKELPGIDPKLEEELAAAMEALHGTQITAKRTKEDALAQSQRLKEARRLWSVLNDTMLSLEDLKNDAVDGMETQRWKVHEDRGNAPLTPDPESPEPHRTSLPTILNPVMLLQQLDELEKCMSTEFKVPFAALAQTLEYPLHKYLLSSSGMISGYVDDMRAVARLWENIVKQSDSMVAAKGEERDLQGKIDTLQANVEDVRQEILNRTLASEKSATLEADFRDQATVLQASVRKFTDSLAGRIPFVSRVDGTGVIFSRSNSISNFPFPVNQHLKGLKEPPALTLPFELSTLDNGLRAEVNALTLGLAGGVQSIDKKLDYLRLARLAIITEAALESLAEDIRISEQALFTIKATLESIKETQPSGLDMSLSQKLSSTREQLDQFMQDHHARISQSTSLVRQELEALQTARGSHDSPVHGTIVAPRAKSVDDALRHAELFIVSCAQLRVDIVEAEKQEDARLSAEKERLQAEEKARLNKERLEAEEKSRLDRERAAASEAARRLAQLEAGAGATSAEALRLEQRLRGKEEVRQAREQKTSSQAEGQETQEDVFGLRLAPSSSAQLSQEMMALRAQILSLRSRLKSLSLSSLAASSAASHDHRTPELPTLSRALELQSDFSSVVSKTDALPRYIPEDPIIESDLRSLRSEVDSAHSLVQRIVQLGQFTDKVATCDHALSDLLEHADIYPAAPPIYQLASSHVSDTRLPYEEQLSNRLVFAERLVEEMSQLASSLTEDSRVIGEERRIRQALSELAEMCADRINGKRSRPVSSISSTGKTSIGSLQSKSKPSLYPRTQRHPRASETTTQRTVSGAPGPTPRLSSHMSNRSVSTPSGFSSLFNSTFASRQRTTSLASIQSAIMTPVKRAITPVTRPRTATNRPDSPTFSERSGFSLASTPSRSTWSRAPRQSFGMMSKNFHLSNRTPKRKAYVANPKSKLDVAVGNVINNFKVPVTMEAVDDGWKDQSGKYWIGEDEPKLCFCRILRSQTVMVRVGGGWCELSNFLRGHFAELLAELPPSPQRKEEKWINSASVLKASETPTSTSTTRGSKTPESQRPDLLLSLQVSKPSDASPQSLRTSSSPGDSPRLTPFQFLRKADASVVAATPSTTKRARNKPTTPSVSPARTNIWRP